VLYEWEGRPRADQAVRNDRPEYVELYEHAQELEDDGDVDGALSALERGMRLAPNAAAFHNRIGVILAMRKREFDRAAAEIERAISLEPDNAHYRNNLGKVMARANRRRGAAAGGR
jgi:Flp pilus assembly protein TadD